MLPSGPSVSCHRCCARPGLATALRWSVRAIGAHLLAVLMIFCVAWEAPLTQNGHSRSQRKLHSNTVANDTCRFKNSNSTVAGAMGVENATSSVTRGAPNTRLLHSWIQQSDVVLAELEHDSESSRTLDEPAPGT